MSVYMHVRLKVRYGQTERASEVIGRLVPGLEERGWKLVAAYKPVIGDLTEIIDVWELPDANSVGTVLEDAATDPAFAAAAVELGDILIDEELQIVTKTSYSP